jgi:ribonuclease E
MTGISRKLPDTERSRLKDILRRIVPDNAGVIIRTAAEGASEEELTRDVQRLQAQWETIQQKAGQTKSAPTLLYSEPDLELRVVRDVFNEDFTKLVVSGEDAWEMISQYVDHVAPDLLPRLSRWTGDGDAFHDLRIEEQLLKGLDRKVYLPSGGSLVIDRTEAMTVIDVNTGKFVGQGGNLEQTVTRNNLEAAEEIVRQLRLRDIGGIIVIDFIDMVLESNRDLVLRRLTECLGRDRTKHQVAEVTSLGLVQMTRKRVGQGLLESFSEPCPTCNGRGVLVHLDPVDDVRKTSQEPAPVKSRRGRRGAVAEAGPPTPALLAGRPAATPDEDGGHPATPEEVDGRPATPDEVDVASEDHRAADEAVDTVEAVEPEADVTVRAEAPPAASAAGSGDLAAAVPDPGADVRNAAEPVADPDAPAPAATRPRRTRRRAAAPAGSPPASTDAPAVIEIDTPSAPATGTAAPAAEPATAATAAGAETPAPGASGAGPLASNGVGPLESVATGTGSTDPDPTEPVAGSNGVVAPSGGTEEFPASPEPVAGSNGAVNGTNGAAPRRRRRAASRPAGPPQPVSTD